MDRAAAFRLMRVTGFCVACLAAGSMLVITLVPERVARAHPPPVVKAAVLDVFRSTGEMAAAASPPGHPRKSPGQRATASGGSEPGPAIQCGAALAAGSAKPAGSGDAAVPVARRLVVDLNSAGMDELEKLPGVGPKKALRILLWRRRHGRFRRVGELQRVKGFGPKTLRRLGPQLTIGPSIDKPAQSLLPSSK